MTDLDLFAFLNRHLTLKKFCKLAVLGTISFAISDVLPQYQESAAVVVITAALVALDNWIKHNLVVEAK